MIDMQLTSSAFSYGNEMPRKIGYKNGNISPSLTIGGIPAEAKSLTLIMDDPDAMGAVGKVWVHWVMWNIDSTITEIAEWERPSGAVEGTTDFGEVGYGGPAPPDKIHTYVLKLYALDCVLDLSSKSTKADIEKAMEGHIVDQTTLEGTYAP